MRSTQSLHYKVLDPRRNYPEFTGPLYATPEEIAHLVESGYLIREDLLSESRLNDLRLALDRIAIQEEAYGDGGCFGGQYLRYLMDKDQTFLDLYRLEEPLSIARAVLGPQVQFDQVDARVVSARKIYPGVPWHIHFRVIPDPLPPFFSYPHAIHCLLYLDDIDEGNGQLCILPGSHREFKLTFPADDHSDKPGQKLLSLRAGSCFIMHCNLWHRTMPSNENGGTRRLIIFGYMPSWMKGDEQGGVKPTQSLRDDYFARADPESRRLLGEFAWG
jgi:ectoine hydroxylase-related dioxygenase (phytanoyl-CoA dioxygenase family)